MSTPLDPRTARTRTAMLSAATHLLEQGGMAAVTHQGVALAAGVGRATVYRHWPRPLDLILATLETSRVRSLDFGEGEIRHAVYEALMTRIDWFNQPIAGTVLGALISGAEHDRSIADIRDGVFGKLAGNLETAVTGAIARGELKAGTPPHVIATLILGAILFERHMLGSTITPQLLAGILDATLVPWQA